MAAGTPPPPPTGVHLRWESISYSVPTKAGDLRLLHDISGNAAPGSTLAIMGASGAGKSTLLNVLAQRITGYTGSVTVNGRALDATTFNRITGYVTQSAPFLEYLTVRETLRYAAMLRLPESMPTADKDARVDAILDDLDLIKCAHTYVGKETEAGGISGGERRRLTLAMELLFDPHLLFADEVTSGLDSASAHRIVTILRRLAKTQHRTVLCSIHQPRADILTQFDGLMLLAGRVVYYGPTWTPGREDGLLAYFRGIGHPFRPFENPADELLDLVNAECRADDAARLSSSASSSAEGDAERAAGAGGVALPAPPAPLPPPLSAIAVDVQESEERAATAARPAATVTPLDIETPAASVAAAPTSPAPSPLLSASSNLALVSRRATRDRSAVIDGLVSAFAASDLARAAKVGPASYPPPAKPVYGDEGRRYPTGFLTQVGVITRRTFVYKLRNPDAVASQFFASVVMAVIVGSVYYKLPLTQSGARDRLAAIAFIILTQSFMAFDLVVLAPLERTIMLRDSMSGMYSSVAFYAGRTLAEFPVHMLLAATVGVITCFMYGLQPGAAQVLQYIVTIMLVTNCGASMLLLVGTAAKTMAAGNALATLVLVFASLFNNFFVSTQNLHPGYRWIAEISFPGFGVAAGITNELRGLKLECSAADSAAGTCVATGDALLETLRFSETSVWRLCVYMLVESVVFRVLAFLCFHFLYTGQSFRTRLRALCC